MSNKVYLELDEKKARFFEYSKEPKEGYEKNESSNGKVSYRKYYNDGVIGVLKFINEREDELKNGGKVKKLSIVLDNGDTRYYLNFNILTAKGNMNQFVEQIVPVLPNLKQNEAYRIFPYEMETTYTDSNGTERTGLNKGVSVYTYDIDNDTKLVKVARAHSFASKDKGGDIPPVVWTKVTKMGETKNVKDDTDRLNFLYDVLKNSLTPQGSTPQTQEKPKQEAPKQEAKPQAQPEFQDEEHDDLPF